MTVIGASVEELILIGALDVGGAVARPPRVIAVRPAGTAELAVKMMPEEEEKSACVERVGRNKTQMDEMTCRRNSGGN